jgi:hypothetical protein
MKRIAITCLAGLGLILAGAIQTAAHRRGAAKHVWTGSSVVSVTRAALPTR